MYCEMKSEPQWFDSTLCYQRFVLAAAMLLRFILPLTDRRQLRQIIESKQLNAGSFNGRRLKNEFFRDDDIESF